MKLQDLFEMPEFINREMPIIMKGTLNFYSMETVDRVFDIIGKVELGNKEYWSILKKDKSFAIIGELTLRKEDQKPGLQILGQVDFKAEPDFAFDRLINLNKNVLQVDSVEVYSSTFKGLGFNLYLSLVDYGYVIVSDHVQYIGGKKLWEKIARLSSASGYSVFIINNGEPLTGPDGKPLEYDGTNLDDEKIWGESPKEISDSRRYVLLTMRKK